MQVRAILRAWNDGTERTNGLFGIYYLERKGKSWKQITSTQHCIFPWSHMWIYSLALEKSREARE